MRIFSLSGVDGSGKSTQGQLLRSYLLQRGKKIVYFHATEFSLANRLFRNSKTFTPGSAPAVTQASLLGVFARILFLFVDGIRFFVYRQKLRLQKVDFVISDRFFQDSLINILYLSDNPLVRLKVWFLALVLPRPDQGFYLRVTREELEERGRIPEQGVAYLDAKIALYDTKFPRWHYITLDACNDIETIQKEILSRLAL